MRSPSRRRALLAVLAAVVLMGCGVEVPDDVGTGDDGQATTEAVPTTTEPPTSDDPLEQALIDNGYSLDEARCAAENLREALDDDEIEDIIEADSLDDISISSAEDFAEAVQPCIEDGAPSVDPDPSDPGDGSDEPDDRRPRAPRRPGTEGDDDGGR